MSVRVCNIQRWYDGSRCSPVLPIVAGWPEPYFCTIFLCCWVRTWFRGPAFRRGVWLSRFPVVVSTSTMSTSTLYLFQRQDLLAAQQLVPELCCCYVLVDLFTQIDAGLHCRNSSFRTGNYSVACALYPFACMGACVYLACY